MSAPGETADCFLHGPFDATLFRCPECKRRVRLDLDGGHMDVSLSPDASPETIEALKDLGQAAVSRMKDDAKPPGTTDTPRETPPTR